MPNHVVPGFDELFERLDQDPHALCADVAAVWPLLDDNRRAQLVATLRHIVEEIDPKGYTSCSV